MSRLNLLHNQLSYQPPSFPFLSVALSHIRRVLVLHVRRQLLERAIATGADAMLDAVLFLAELGDDTLGATQLILGVLAVSALPRQFQTTNPSTSFAASSSMFSAALAAVEK